MTGQTDGAKHATLSITRIFDAPIERVFDAWSNAEVLASWFCNGVFAKTSAEIDLKVGGKYSIVLQPHDGEPVTHHGTYVEVNRPVSLIFTWILGEKYRSDSSASALESLVSLAFRTLGDKTELILLHEQLPNQLAYDDHGFGWNINLDLLVTHLQTPNSAP